MIFTTQTISYTYDKLNQLTSVSNYGNLGLDGSSIEYFYDDDGVVRFIMTSAGIFGNNVNVNLYAYVYDGAGNITDLVQLKMQRPQFPLVSASLAAHYEYDAYGRIVSETNYARTENIAKLNPIRYKGYYYETDTEMYRLDSRYYDPLIGRFINADDPSLLTESPNDLTDKNLYNYCDNNPVMRKDSDGEFWHVVIGAAIGGGLEAIDQLLTYGKIEKPGAIFVAAGAGALTATTGFFMGAVISGASSFSISKMKGEDTKTALRSAGASAGLSLVGSGVSASTFKGAKAAYKDLKTGFGKFKSFLKSKEKLRKTGQHARKWRQKNFTRNRKYQRHRDKSILNSARTGSINLIYSGARKR